jgi:hypothetical protein
VIRTFSLLLPLLLLLASCGDLPEPFIGNPGATGKMLAKPPTARLAVPPTANALLSDAPSRQFASVIARGLQEQEIPAVAEKAKPSDWQLATTAEQRGDAVVAVFSVLNPKGEDKGKVESKPVPTATWADASPGMLEQVALDAAPRIATLLNSIQTAQMHADPNSLYNRVAKVQVATVTGAPGDGNLSLTKQMKSHLAALGPQLQDSAAGADFIVQGRVKMVPIAGGQQRVEIQWSVATASGDERGKVVQLNDIPAGSLDHYWADVAMVVANEAAGGVNDVILRQSGREPTGGGPDPQANAAPQKDAVHGQAKGALLEGRSSGVEPVR